ncbi:MAG TPA: HEAT repeat domain-containing protein [Blastocatellia bacterium]|nr:HEAT repeat domain-containing protein [Blastocatellia bacterium]
MWAHEDALELNFNLPCGSSRHPVSMTLTRWGAVKMSSPCLLLPESARRLAASTCPQALDEVKRFVQKVLYVRGADPPKVFTRKMADQLRAFFARSHEGARERAKALLREWGYTEDESGLRAALVFEAPAVRWAAAVVTGEKRLAALVPELMRASGDEEFAVQVASVRALAQIADAQAVPILCRWLGKKESLIPEIRSQIARALGDIGDARAGEPLIEALKDEDQDVCQAAAEALVGMGAAAVEPLIAALEDGRVRWAAVEALGRIGDARAVEPLIKALGYKGRDIVKPGYSSKRSFCVPDLLGINIRRAAAEALGRIGDARAVKPLIEALGDDRVRKAAVEALVMIGAAAVEPLIAVVKDGRKESKEAVRVLLRLRGRERVIALGEVAVEPLIEVLEDPDVRWAAVEALGGIRDARAVEPLIKLLRDWMIREAAVEALASIGAAAVKPLIKALNSSDPRVREAVAEAIERIGEPALEPLIGRWIVHPRYGRGRIEKIYRERPPCLVVKFKDVPDEGSRRIVSLRDNFLLE